MQDMANRLAGVKLHVVAVVVTCTIYNEMMNFVLK